MIYDKLDNLVQYDTKNNDLKRAYKSILNKEYLTFKAGKNIIDGDCVFAMKVDLTLKDIAEGEFEAHREYIDIHLPLVNCEDVEVVDVNVLEVTSAYNEEDDCLLGIAKATSSINLEPGTFLVVYPDDAHKVGVSKQHINESYKKIIYKVKV